MQTDAMEPVVIDIEDERLPNGNFQSLRLTVWMNRPSSPEALPHEARVAAIAFMERAISELRS